MSDAYDDDLGEGAEWLELNEENQRLRAAVQAVRDLCGISDFVFTGQVLGVLDAALGGERDA